MRLSTTGLAIDIFQFHTIARRVVRSVVRPAQKQSRTWWHHQMETFTALLAFCAGNSPVPGELPAQGPVTRSFDVFFDLRLNKRPSKQSWGWWSETPSSSLWRHRNEILASSLYRIKSPTIIRLQNRTIGCDNGFSATLRYFQCVNNWVNCWRTYPEKTSCKGFYDLTKQS